MRRTVISLAFCSGNAIGLIVAAALLDKMELDFSAFISR